MRTIGLCVVLMGLNMASSKLAWSQGADFRYPLQELRVAIQSADQRAVARILNDYRQLDVRQEDARGLSKNYYNKSIFYYHTYLTDAVLTGNKEIVKQILGTGADLRAANAGSFYKTALDAAMDVRDPAIIELLIDRENVQLMPPLLFAALQNNTAQVEVLASQGQNVSVQTRYGTPLLLAIRNKNTAMAKYLMGRGALIEVFGYWKSSRFLVPDIDYDGKTNLYVSRPKNVLLQMAREVKAKEIEDLLIKAGAREELPLPKGYIDGGNGVILVPLPPQKTP